MKRRQFLSTTFSAALATAVSAAVPEKKWRVGIIGHTGRGDYGHGLHTMWLELPDAEIVGVADADPKGLESARTKLRGPRGYASYRDLLATEKPEIVAVCPRHVDQHAEMIIAAAEAGVKGVYVEKPFCRTPAEADAIVQACTKHRMKVGIAHRNRYHPALPVVKKLIEEGLLGRVLEMRGRGKEDQRGGGLDLWVLGSHVVNLMHFFGGPAKSCSATIWEGDRLATKEDIKQGPEGTGPLVGDRLHARYELADGTIAYFDSIKAAGVREANFGLQIIGSKGIVDLRVDVEPLAHFVPGNPFLPTKEPRPWIPITSGGLDKPEPVAGIKAGVAGHLIPARDLMAAIQENRPTLCSAEDGRVTVEMICGVFASHLQNSKAVPLPLQVREHPLSSP